MKKKLEADLISIAHRILKIKNKSDINQLYLETQKLYEKLAVLKFVDENFDGLKPTIGHSEINSEIEAIFEKEETTSATPAIEETASAEETPTETITVPEITEAIKTEETTAEITAEIPEEVIPEPVAATIEQPVVEEAVQPLFETEKETENTEELSFTTINEAKPIPDFKPAFEFDTSEEKEPEKEEPKAETSSKTSPVPISFEDFGINYADAQFIKVDSFESVPKASTPSINEIKEPKIETAVLETPAASKPVTLNEKLAKGFHIDLNDRIAFTKNLFGNSSEDYSRVLNQLLTFDSYNEAQEFIENMVKPDYNNWEGKDDYAERFLGIIEKKFS